MDTEKTIDQQFDQLNERMDTVFGIGNRPFKIACVGPSGSGKTTMAEYLAKKLNMKFIRNSAGLIIPKATQEQLFERYGWSKSGHKDVIRLSHINPEFGLEYQKAILEARTAIIHNTESFIMDRSPIDNVTYFITQASMYQPIAVCEDFINHAREVAQELTHLFAFHTMDYEVEDNQSRVSNVYFQRSVDAVFDDTLKRYFEKPMKLTTRITHLKTWDLIEKKSIVLQVFDELLNAQEIGFNMGGGA